MTILHRDHAVASEPGEGSDQLPRQDWCESCAIDQDSEPGMPQDVVDQSIEQLALQYNAVGLLVEVTFLACGHTITRPISEQRSGW